MMVLPKYVVRDRRLRIAADVSALPFAQDNVIPAGIIHERDPVTLEHVMAINHPNIGLQTLALERDLLYRQAIAVSQAKQAVRPIIPESDSGASIPASINAVLNSVRTRREPDFLIVGRRTAAASGS